MRHLSSMLAYRMTFSVVWQAGLRDRISNCPLERVLTYKNLIYLLNLQFCVFASCVLWIFAFTALECMNR